jgi:hypothetical protein
VAAALLRGPETPHLLAMAGLPSDLGPGVVATTTTTTTAATATEAIP